MTEEQKEEGEEEEEMKRVCPYFRPGLLCVITLEESD